MDLSPLLIFIHYNKLISILVICSIQAAIFYFAPFTFSALSLAIVILLCYCIVVKMVEPKSMVTVIKKNFINRISKFDLPNGPTGNLQQFNLAMKENFPNRKEVESDLAFTSFVDIFKTNATRLYPHCYDIAENRVYFCLIDETVDDVCDKATFFYQACRAHAVGLYAVPLDQLQQLITLLENESEQNKNLFNFDDVLFVFSTGRCGSTLVSNVLDQLVNCQSISEPDIFTLVAFNQNNLTEEESSKILKLTTKLLVFSRRKQFPARNRICLKFRGQATMVWKTMEQFNCKAIFLYRDVAQTFESFYQAFLPMWTAKVGFIQSIFFKLATRYFYFFISDCAPFFKSTLKDIEYKEVCEQGVEVFPALGWLNIMKQAIELVQCKTINTSNQQPFFFTAVTFEDIVSRKTDCIVDLIHTLNWGADIDSSKLEEAAKVFTKDSHAKGGVKGRRTNFSNDNNKQKKDEASKLKVYNQAVMKKLHRFATKHFPSVLNVATCSDSFQNFQIPNTLQASK